MSLNKEDMQNQGIIRRSSTASNGWNNGDLDVCKQLFSCGMVGDGNLVSKSSRDYLVYHGYAVRHEGMQSLTGKGIHAYLKFLDVNESEKEQWFVISDLLDFIQKKLIASPETIKRAMD